MDSIQLQQTLFQHIKNTLPQHLSLVDEIADLLGISNDSAYRRIRGEKPITLEEIEKLVTHYNISLDHFFHLKSDSFIFTGKLGKASDRFFDLWLDHLLKQFEYFNSFDDRKQIFVTKDLPFIALFEIPVFAQFKFYFWMKSFLHYEELKGVKFDPEDRRLDPLIEKAKEISGLYNNIHTTEVWNIENINSNIRQIEFCREAGIFTGPSVAALLYEKLEAYINHVELMAEAGQIYSFGKAPNSQSPEFRMFNNELIMGDNTLLEELNGRKHTYLNHSIMNFMLTTDVPFNEHIFDTIGNLIKKSALISTTAEKERIRFFNRLREKIRHFK